MPDIATSDKVRIRARAKNFVLDLWGGPFKNSFLVYDITLRALYKHAARWNFCLLCGEIDIVKNLTTNHDCIKDYTEKLSEDQLSNPKNIPMIISTSWIKLKEFFLTNKHITTLNELGVEIKYKEDIPVITTSKDVSIVKEDISEKEKARIQSDSS
ncbi:MAG: hypothetical protein GPJ51_08935 [Candidatus Heimdallarchaeota archaeon]|nr:hypothetical protein [Candidatus Heimdallarchaeota archaeon]